MNRTAKAELVLIVILLFSGYFFFNDVIGLRAEEPRRAVVGIEALMGENALVPAIHGEPYYNKPPVYNWVLAASFFIHDSFKPGAVRLPGVLSLWIIAVFIFWLVRRYGEWQNALFAALIFLTFGDLIYYGAVNAGEIDLFFSLVVFLQAIAVFHYHQQKKYTLLFTVSYLLAAVGTLTKGLPSVAFQGLTLFAYLIWKGDARKLVSWKHLSGIAIYSFLVGGYFLIYNKYEDATAFVLNLYSESSTKSANTAGAQSIFKAIYTFPLQLIQITLPWSVFLIWIRKVKWKQSPVAVFSIVFLAANIWIYWISPELRNRYLYAFFPFLAIILAHVISDRVQIRRFDFILSRISAGLASVIAVAFIVLPFTEAIPNISELKVHFIICGIFFVALSAIQFRISKNGALHVIVVLAFLRVAYNVCILPLQAAEDKATYYAGQVEEMRNISENEEILWTGRPYTFRPELSLLGMSFMRDSIKTPPLLAYQIPYYYTLLSDQRLLFADRTTEGKWYLGEKQFALSEGGKIYYEFKDQWTRRDLVLYQIEKP